MRIFHPIEALHLVSTFGELRKIIISSGKCFKRVFFDIFKVYSRENQDQDDVKWFISELSLERKKPKKNFQIAFCIIKIFKFAEKGNFHNLMIFSGIGLIHSNLWWYRANFRCTFTWRKVFEKFYSKQGFSRKQLPLRIIDFIVYERFYGP